MLAKFATFVVAFSLGAPPSPATAADSLKVSLDVTANANVKGNAETYLRKELARLKDVEMVDPRDADVVVRASVLELTTKGAQKTGVAVAMMVLTPFDNRFITTAAQEKYKATVGTLTQALFYSPDLYLRSGAANELEQVCKEVVAQLDGGLLEDIRKTRHQIEEALRSYKPARKN